MLNKSKGITLVALVVTIVVLLILASVSISLVLGQNGLINNAKDVKNKTLEAEKTEGESLNTASDYIKQTVGVTASGITAEDYGKVVTNYQDGSNVWEIFYADNNNVYLITRNNVGDQTLENAIQEESKYNGTSDFDGSETFKQKYPAIQAGWLYKTYIPSQNEAGKINYSSNYKNMKATEYLLDSSIWNVSYKTDKAEWAVGAPTLEMFVKSYNKYFDTKIVIEDENNAGYDLTINDGIKKNTVFNRNFNYWLASPSKDNQIGVNFVDNIADHVGKYTVNDTNGIRPVVCLKSSVILKESSDGTTYTIE